MNNFLAAESTQHQPVIKRILQSYKARAENSLEGPNDLEMLTDMALASSESFSPNNNNSNAKDSESKDNCVTGCDSSEGANNPNTDALQISNSTRTDADDANDPAGNQMAIVRKSSFPLVVGYGNYETSSDKPKYLDFFEWKVAYFDIGGEPRLCLAHLLNTALQDYSTEHIRPYGDLLHIYYSPCTPAQVRELKLAGILNSTVSNVHLIRRSDAERLVSAILLNSIETQMTSAATGGTECECDSEGGLKWDETLKNEEDNEFFYVTHDTFGRAWGKFFPKDYSVQCLQCGDPFAPDIFCCHTHKYEVTTCHWGFKFDNWQLYLRLVDDLPETSTSKNVQERFNEAIECGKLRQKSASNRKRKIESTLDAENVVNSNNIVTASSVPAGFAQEAAQNADDADSPPSKCASSLITGTDAGNPSPSKNDGCINFSPYSCKAGAESQVCNDNEIFENLSRAEMIAALRNTQGELEEQKQHCVLLQRKVLGLEQDNERLLTFIKYVLHTGGQFNAGILAGAGTPIPAALAPHPHPSGFPLPFGTQIKPFLKAPPFGIPFTGHAHLFPPK